MTILIPVVRVLTPTLFVTMVTKTDQNRLIGGDAARSLFSLDPKSLEYKHLASTLNTKTTTFRLLRITVSVSGRIIAWLFLPGLPVIVIGGIHFYIPVAWLNDCMKSRGRNIDQLVSIAKGYTFSGLLADGSIPNVLQQVGESLELEKTNFSRLSLF